MKQSDDIKATKVSSGERWDHYLLVMAISSLRAVEAAWAEAPFVGTAQQRNIWTEATERLADTLELALAEEQSIEGTAEYFRLADGIVFPHLSANLWIACDSCSASYGIDRKSLMVPPKFCMSCGGPIRPLSLADLASQLPFPALLSEQLGGSDAFDSRSDDMVGTGSDEADDSEVVSEAASVPKFFSEVRELTLEMEEVEDADDAIHQDNYGGDAADSVAALEAENVVNGVGISRREERALPATATLEASITHGPQEESRGERRAVYLKDIFFEASAVWSDILGSVGLAETPSYSRSVGWIWQNEHLQITTLINPFSGMALAADGEANEAAEEGSAGDVVLTGDAALVNKAAALMRRLSVVK